MSCPGIWSVPTRLLIEQLWYPTQANKGLEWATHHLLFGQRFGFVVGREQRTYLPLENLECLLQANTAGSFEQCCVARS